MEELLRFFDDINKIHGNIKFHCKYCKEKHQFLRYNCIQKPTRFAINQAIHQANWQTRIYSQQIIPPKVANQEYTIWTSITSKANQHIKRRFTPNIR